MLDPLHSANLGLSSDGSPTKVLFEQLYDLLWRSRWVLNRDRREVVVHQRGQRKLPQARVRSGDGGSLPALLNRSVIQRVWMVIGFRSGVDRNTAVVEEPTFLQYRSHLVVILQIWSSETHDFVFRNAS